MYDTPFLIGYCAFIVYDIFVGYLLFKDFCENISEEPVPQMSFYDEVSSRCSSFG